MCCSDAGPLPSASLVEGIERHQIDGAEVPVFNAAKTIADCFKLRNKASLDVALEALRDAWSQRKVMPFAIDWLLLALSNRAAIGDADGPTVDVLRAALYPPR